jgi:hypothetical protein
MGIFDKAKEQANQAAERVSTIAKAGQAKIEDIQQTRQTDLLFRDLGAAVFAQRTDRASSSTEAEIDSLVDELLEREQSMGPFDLTRQSRHP